MTRCSRCRRPLRHPVYFADMVFGRDCARAVGAAITEKAGKKRKGVVVERDERTRDLFSEDVR